MANKLRPLGKTLLDLEVLLEELVDVHELQYSDILYLIYGWLEVHRPEAKEKYIEGGSPVFTYGYKK